MESSIQTVQDATVSESQQTPEDLDELLHKSKTSLKDGETTTGTLDNIRYAIPQNPNDTHQSLICPLQIPSRAPQFEKTADYPDEKYDVDFSELQPLQRPYAELHRTTGDLYLYHITDDGTLNIYLPKITIDNPEEDNPTRKIEDLRDPLHTAKNVYTPNSLETNPFQEVSTELQPIESLHNNAVLWYDGHILTEVDPQAFGKITTDNNSYWTPLSQEQLELTLDNETDTTIEITTESTTITETISLQDKLSDYLTSTLSIANYAAYLIAMISTVLLSNITQAERLFTLTTLTLTFIVFLAILYKFYNFQTESHSIDRAPYETPLSKIVDKHHFTQQTLGEEYQLLEIEELTDEQIKLTDIDSNNSITVTYDSTLDNEQLSFFKTVRGSIENSDNPFIVKLTQDPPEDEQTIEISEHNHTYDDYNSVYLTPSIL